MTSFSSSGISQGSSNSGSFMTNQDPHSQQQNYNTPMRVHFTDGSTAGSNLGSTREGILKVIYLSLMLSNLNSYTYFD